MPLAWLPSRFREGLWVGSLPAAHTVVVFGAHPHPQPLPQAGGEF